MRPAWPAAFDNPRVDQKNLEHVARLEALGSLWKSASWCRLARSVQFGVSQVRPDVISVTQSPYGFSAFTDGYYFNVGAACR